MKCKRARKLLVRFDDAELGGETADELRRHLGHCRECSRQLDFLGRSLDAARNVDPAARLPGTPHPILPSREVYACRSVRLREMFLGISLLVRFRKRLAGLACICLLGLTAVVLCYRFRSSSEVQAVNASSKSDTATIRSESVSGALALIDLFIRPCKTIPAGAPLYPDNDRDAIRAAIELASARAYIATFHMPEEGRRKYQEILEQFPATEAAEVARRELSNVGRKES